jgi:hypothetical protein
LSPEGVRGAILTSGFLAIPLNQLKKGYQSCHVEPFSHLLHPLSSVSGSLGPFQLTPPHIALASIAAVSTAAVSIAGAFTVVATTVVYAREWRSASVLPLSVLLRWALPPRVLITALLPRSVVHTATIIMLLTTAAYPRHNSCHTGRTSEKPKHLVGKDRRAE